MIEMQENMEGVKKMLVAAQHRQKLTNGSLKILIINPYY
jgi:hypothetical protein